MKNFFNITDEQLFNKKYIKVIDGIAGSAKSSNIDKIFKNYGIEYGRYTSTNRLKRDAEQRYGGHNDTIAGGLFKTINGEFYADFKVPDYDNVVIDEFLQTNTRIFEWCEEFYGEINIILLTDKKQMLSPYSEQLMQKKYNEFIKNANIIYITMQDTKRARTEETKKAYMFAYNSVDDKKRNIFNALKEHIPSISFEEMPYNKNDVYICHTKKIEEKLYNTFNLSYDYTQELIQKGNISRKDEIQYEKYAILPQNKVMPNASYLQVQNIGTPTRYQGGEVKTGQKLYYIIEKASSITNREFYTVITRLYDIRDLIIVYAEVQQIEPLTIYNKRPIKEKIIRKIEEDFVFNDGTRLSEKEKDGNVIYLSEDEILEIYREQSERELMRNDCFLYNNYIIKKQKEKRSTRTTMYSLLKKEPEFMYSFMPEFYRKFEKIQRGRFMGASVIEDLIKVPHIQPVYDGEDIYEEDKTKQTKKEFKYGIDLMSAYPHILHNEDLPIDGEIYDKPGQNTIDFYLTYDGYYTKEGAIITGELKNEIEDLSGYPMPATYICSVNKKHGSRMGNWLYDNAFKSVESKAKIKNIHYGLLERPYLQRAEYDGKGNVLSYIINNNNRSQLLMIAILSNLTKIILRIKKEIYGNLYYGLAKVDCLYFDYDGDIYELGERIKNIIPDYNFRIFENNEEQKILYKTYEELKTKRQIKTEKQKERRNNTRQ